MALGGGDALAGVAEFDVALEVKPAGGGIGVAFNDHRPFAVGGKVEMDIAVNVLLLHVLKAHNRFCRTAHYPAVFDRQQLPGAEPGGGNKHQAGEGEKGARGDSHCGFHE